MGLLSMYTLWLWLLAPMCAAFAPQQLRATHARPPQPQVRATHARRPAPHVRATHARLPAPHVRATHARLLAPRRAAKDDDVLSSVGNATAGLIEGAVRSVTGDGSYKFGDITKRAVAGLTGKDGTFGDLNDDGVVDEKDAALALQMVGDRAKNAVTSFTGKEDYEFGDVGRKILSETERAANELRASYFNDLPAELSRAMFSGLNAKQREALMVAVASYGSVLVLTWSLVSNAMTGLKVVASWAYATRTAAAASRWSDFIRTIYTLRLFEAALLPLKALAAYALVPRYHALVLRLEPRVPLREKTTLHRALALALTYVLGTAAVGAATALGVLLVPRPAPNFCL